MKSFEIRRPSTDQPVVLMCTSDGKNGYSLAVKIADVVTLIPLDAPLADGSKCQNGAPRTVRLALLEQLLVGCTLDPGAAPAPAARSGREVRELLFELDDEGNIRRAIDQPAS